MSKDISNAVVKLEDDAIYIFLDDAEDPITVPASRYPKLKDGDRVYVHYTGVGILRVKKV